MGSKRTALRSIFAASSVAALLTMTAGPASAAVAAAGPGSSSAGYVTRTVVAQKGGSLTFMNGDITDHTLTADAFLPRKIARKTKRCNAYPTSRCPLFTSPTVGDGESAPVAGLRYVKPGRQYEFYCQIHSGMRGTLVVPPTATRSD